MLSLTSLHPISFCLCYIYIHYLATSIKAWSETFCTCMRVTYNGSMSCRLHCCFCKLAGVFVKIVSLSFTLGELWIHVARFPSLLLVRSSTRFQEKNIPPPPPPPPSSRGRTRTSQLAINDHTNFCQVFFSAGGLIYWEPFLFRKQILV